ncbi:MAG TPA: PHP domain-containing protein [Candidatus Limnocylindrales bacterium]
MAAPQGSRTGRAFIDLHCHTRASFDSLSDPVKVAETAASRGLTHLVITDHDRVDGALEAQAAAPADLTVIVGEEIRVREGDLIAAFIREAVPPGLSAREAIAAVREQGGLVGVPHPLDRFRGFGRGRADLEAIAAEVDWIEAYNARVLNPASNGEAAHVAREQGVPGVAVSDAHSLLEVGVAYCGLGGDPSTPEGLLAALAEIELVTGRATYLVRGWTPLAKLVQRLRGNGRVRAGATR